LEVLGFDALGFNKLKVDVNDTTGKDRTCACLCTVRLKLTAFTTRPRWQFLHQPLIYSKNKKLAVMFLNTTKKHMFIYFYVYIPVSYSNN
jgi:hypothetical protein